MHDHHAMPGLLAEFLRRHRDDVESIEVIEYEPMAGGYSRSMARARIRYTNDGVSLEESVVLRGDPPPGHSMIETDRGSVRVEELATGACLLDRVGRE